MAKHNEGKDTMLTLSLSTFAQLTPVQRSVSDHFQKGGSAGTVMGVLLVLGLVVWLAFYLTGRRQRSQSMDRESNHTRLFEELLNALELSATHRHQLELMAGDLDLEHPAVMLLSPTIFDRLVTQWRRTIGRSGPDAPTRPGPSLTSEIRGRLFPNTLAGFVDSRHWVGLDHDAD